MEKQMTTKNFNYSLFALLASLLLVIAVSCTRDIDLLEPATYPKTPEVFIDGFSAGLNYAAFGGSKVTAFDVDTEVKYKGKASMKFAVPDFEDPEGAYAGGAYFTNTGRDLSGYDALTFWAKASKAATIDVLGFGNDLDELKYVTTLLGTKVNTNWKKYIIPIPDPAKLTAERGMFYYSEGPEDGAGYTFWIDEVKFEKLGTIAHPRPSILEEQDQVISSETGEELTIGGTFAVYNMPSGTDQRFEVAPSYFSFTSSDPTVANVNEKGIVSVIDSGTAVITAKLGKNDAKGSLTIEAVGALAKPSAPAPAPTINPDSVISLFSNVYTNVTVDTWNPFWQYSTAEVKDVKIAGDDVKLYKKLNFVGIEFTSQTIDASNMTHFHIDIWTPDPTSAAEFEAKLVDFGADGVFGGDNDSEIGIKVTPPKLVSKEWIGVDISLAGLSNKAHMAQLILVGNENLNNVYIDNVYFYNDGSGNGGGGGGSTQPTQAAPTPTQNESDVISLFSDAYTDVTVDTWRTDWSSANFEDVTIAGNAAKKYSELNFVGISTETSTLDASGMTHLHLDVWSADFTQLGIKLVDFGANGVYDGGGDDVEHQIDIANPTQGEWISLDIPFSDFTNLTTRGHLAQYILVGQPTGATTVYIDNFYFYNNAGGGSTEPTQAAPTPTFGASDVISLFSNAYSNVNVDTWSADWDAADVADIQIQGNDTKLYTNIVYAGIEFTSQTIDAASMTHFHMDIWTPDETAAPKVFKIKLVDFGANGVYDGGGDDVEHELFLDNTTTPAMGTGKWVKLDIPLSNFTGLTTRGHMAQLIISGDPNTVYVDNILFHK